MDLRVDLEDLLQDGIGHFQSLVLHQDDVIRVQIFVQSLFNLTKKRHKKRGPRLLNAGQ